MRKKLIATFSLLALLLSPSLINASAADFIDDQFYELPLPTNEAGYLGARVDDSVSFTFSSFLIANDDDGIKNGIGIPCDDFKDAECSKYPRFTYNIFLPPCSATITDDCITAITAIKSDGSQISGKLLGSKPDIATPAFKGDPSFNMPDGWFPTVWSFDGIKHPGGNEFLLRASLFSFQNKRSVGVITPQIRVSVSAVSWKPDAASGNWSKETRIFNYNPVTKMMSAGGAASPTCNFFLAIKECAVSWSMPTDVRFKVELKTKAKVSGWVNGRLSDPNVVVSPNGSGQAISIEAGAIPVPIFAMYKKFSEYSKEFQDFNQRVGGGAGRIMFPDNWRTEYSGSGREPFDKISAFHALNTYDEQAFTEFQYFLAASDDKAIATKNLWHFESNRLFFQDGDLNLNECSKNLTGLAGIVTTNSTMFMATPPKFNSTTQTLDYKVAAPHFDRNGKENIGRYNLVIDSNVARCLYKFSTAPIQASVSIINADGTQQVSTSAINEKNGWLYLSVNGYTYSSPTLKVKLSQESSTPTPTPAASASAEPIAAALPPVMINPLKAKTISVKVGKVVVFNVSDPINWKGKVADAKIAKFIPGGPQSTYETNPSLTILKKGKTSVSLTNGKKTYLLKLTVS